MVKRVQERAGDVLKQRQRALALSGLCYIVTYVMVGSTTPPTLSGREVVTTAMARSATSCICSQL